MSACDGADKITGTCAPKSDESSEGMVEGQWVGISIGIWIALMVIFWLIRTCTNKTRRGQALHRFCCKDKSKPETSVECGEQGQVTEGSSTPVYYTPCSPPSYEDVVRGSPQASKNNAAFEWDEADAAFSKGKNIRKLGLKKSRTTLSTMSLSLAPIEEDVNEPKHSSQPRLPSSLNPQLELKSLTSRWTSQPSRLTAMGNGTCHFSCGNEEEEEGEEGSVDKNGNLQKTNGNGHIHCKGGTVSESVAVKNVKNQMNVKGLGIQNNISDEKKDRVIMGINLNGDDSDSGDEKDETTSEDVKDVVVDML